MVLMVMRRIATKIHLMAKSLEKVLIKLGYSLSDETYFDTIEDLMFLIKKLQVTELKYWQNGKTSISIIFIKMQ
jgi:hypothetical protein